MKVSGSLMLLLLLLLLTGCGQPTDQPIKKPVPLGAVPHELIQAIRTAYPQSKLDSAIEYSGMTGSGYIVQFHDDHWGYTINLRRLALIAPFR